MKVMSRSEYHGQTIHPDGPRDTATLLMDDGIVILAPDGRALYELRLLKDGVSLEVHTGSTVKVADRVLDTKLSIAPSASNEVVISRPEYK